MREKIRDKGRLQHMLEMAHALRDEKSNHSYEEILKDRILFYGLTKMTEIIGEAAYKLTHEFVDSHPELPWGKIISMRHILVHGYFKISPEDLWNTIQYDIPPMIPILEKYLDEFEN
ncbi:MAG: DUF86 domain-containing protein [Muribaculaceae bacterium]|nr:DUF86 domain-containing protein [Muribaculaceae bacterium]MDE6753826.1 DUF86 domain-containing protein [Muribaculaceae bacterium]